MAGPTQSFVTEALYKNKTLVGNWWEDRHHIVDTMTGDHLLGKDRVMAQDFPESVADFKTSNQAFQDLKQYHKAPVTVTKKSMISPAAASQRLQTSGTPESLTYTMGQLGTQDLSSSGSSHFATTNQVFYEEKPELAKTTRPDLYEPLDKSYNRGDFQKASMDMSRTKEMAQESCGGKGNRGPLTRRPLESGNPYGVSVYVDEYGEWENKIAGKMTLGETVRSMQTKYF